MNRQLCASIVPDPVEDGTAPLTQRLPTAQQPRGGVGVGAPDDSGAEPHVPNPEQFALVQAEQKPPAT